MGQQPTTAETARFHYWRECYALTNQQLLETRILECRTMLVDLLAKTGQPPTRINAFDNDPTWDNATGGGGFDNRPTWDNWDKK
jgi:hypothetical protein